MNPQLGPLGAGGLAACLIALMPATASGQEFLITSFGQLPAGRPVIQYAADPDYYYILYRGTTVIDIVSAVDLAPGVPLEGQLEALDPLPTAGFYHVRQVPISDPLDINGDGIDDVWELLHRRPGAAVVAFPEGMADGHAFYPARGHATMVGATAYKQEQDGAAVPWDLRFPGVVQLDTGMMPLRCRPRSRTCCGRPRSSLVRPRAPI